METTNKPEFALSKINYILILVGIVMIVVGLLLMYTESSDNPNVFNEKMFDTQRIVIAPIIVFAGFLFEIYAIMKKPKTEE